MTVSEERLQLMEEFRHDMGGIDPTTATVDENPHPSFKRDSLTFKFEHSSYLFKVWNAGRRSAQSELAALREELTVTKLRENQLIANPKTVFKGLCDLALKQRDELAQRLTAAEQRNAELIASIIALPDEFKELSGCENTAGVYACIEYISDWVTELAEPTESGASE